MSFKDLAQQRYSDLVAHAGDGERLFRERAWMEFERLGLPGGKNENWKYSSLAGIEAKAWHPPPAGLTALPASVSAAVAQWSQDFDVAVIENGRLLSDAGGRVGAHRPQPGADLKFEDGFLGLTAAIYQGGYQLDIANGSKSSRPLLLIHFQCGLETWISTVNQLHVGPGAEVELAELFIGSEGSYLRSDITQVTLGDGAKLHWVRVQQDDLAATHFSEVQAQLAKLSVLEVTQLNAGAQWSRTSLKADIHGLDAEARVNGLSFGRMKQHVDQRVRISHHAGPSQSSQLFKGVLKDQSRGVLNGKIYIAQDAQKVISSQLNHNLLLSSGAEADTQPELEIYADDVKANHGASIGRLDEDKLFYLLSRAIPRDEAVHMLARAFVGDVIMKISSPGLRNFVSARMEETLPAFTRDMEAI
jgi:Fe-S cluster assembly protein SufD